MFGSILTLLLVTVVGITMLTLIIKAENTWNRVWAIFLLVTFCGWMGSFLVAPLGALVWTGYALVFFVVSMTMGAYLSTHRFKAASGPYMTREEETGIQGTRDALKLLLWVWLIGAMISMSVEYLMLEWI